MTHLSPNVLCLCDDARDALLWARNGLAVAVFPASMASWCDGLYLQDIEVESLKTETLLVWKKDRHPSDALKEFLSICREGLSVS